MYTHLYLYVCMHMCVFQHACEVIYKLEQRVKEKKKEINRRVFLLIAV